MAFLSDLDRLDDNSIVNIIAFLRFSDSVNIAYINKAYYNRFLIFCYRHSFVSLDMHKIRKRDVNALSSQTHLQKITIADVMRNANCITNIIDLSRLGTQLHTLKYVNLSKKFNVPWNANVLPNSVEVISFHDKSKFNYNFRSINLPQYLRVIQFGYMFDKNIDSLPDTVEIIRFCKNARFNQYINHFPSNLKEIYFGSEFNKPIHNLPIAIAIIYFSNGSRFNNAVDYPQTLKKIHFGQHFNQPITVYPKIIKFHINAVFNKPLHPTCGLMYLYLGRHFNNALDLSDAVSLKILYFYQKSVFNRPIVAPGSLESLHVGKRFNNEITASESVVIKFPHNSRFANTIRES